MKTLEEVKAEYLEEALSNPAGLYVVEDDDGNVVANSASPFPHSFDGGKTWVEAKKKTTKRYRSADGKYYTKAKLPENGDEFCTKKYAAEVKAERNSRIDDTDDYVRLTDMTVKVSADEDRRALTEAEREEVLAYRQALRDFPESEGFPFVEFPEIPACISYECSALISQRESMKEMF